MTSGTGRTISEDRWASQGIDTTVPHSARMYDWWLGGTTNFAPDRALGELFVEAIPEIRSMAQENRRFLGRVVRHLAVEAGIRQFLDIGTGIPTESNVHEVAQAVAPDSRVVYVDNDPIVLAHAQTLMESDLRGRTAYVQADLRDPEALLREPALNMTLEWDRPIGLIMVAVLMLLSDDEDPWARARTLMDAVPSGSHLAITHPGRDFDPEAMDAITTAAAKGDLTVVPRTRAEVERFFEGWELVEPGLVPVLTWRPDDERPPENPNGAYYWAGLARKP